MNIDQIAEENEEEEEKSSSSSASDGKVIKIEEAGSGDKDYSNTEDSKYSFRHSSRIFRYQGGRPLP